MKWVHLLLKHRTVSQVNALKNDFFFSMDAIYRLQCIYKLINGSNSQRVYVGTYSVITGEEENVSSSQGTEMLILLYSQCLGPTTAHLHLMCAHIQSKTHPGRLLFGFSVRHNLSSPFPSRNCTRLPVRSVLQVYLLIWKQRVSLSIYLGTGTERQKAASWSASSSLVPHLVQQLAKL